MHRKFAVVLVPVLLFVAFGILASVPRPKSDTVANRSQFSPIEAGQIVSVVEDGTELKLGEQTLATLDKEDELRVLKIKGIWVGCAANIQGQETIGWVHRPRLRKRKRHLARRPNRIWDCLQQGPPKVRLSGRLHGRNSSQTS